MQFVLVAAPPSTPALHLAGTNVPGSLAWQLCSGFSQPGENCGNGTWGSGQVGEVQEAELSSGNPVLACEGLA